MDEELTSLMGRKKKTALQDLHTFSLQTLSTAPVQAAV